MFYMLLILLLVSIILEGTLTTLPLVFVCLLCLLLIKREAVIFPIALLSGIFLDLFAVRPIGASSIYLLITLFLVFLYQRKYEIYSIPFVSIAAFLGSWFYLMIFGYKETLIQSLVSSFIAIILFKATVQYSKEKHILKNEKLISKNIY